MPDEATIESFKVAMEKRILNEFSTKILNEEKVDRAIESREASGQSSHTTLSFHCECDDKACNEIIVMSTDEYAQVHRKTRNFVVVPSHVRLDIEEIVISFKNYVIVGKFFPAGQAQ